VQKLQPQNGMGYLAAAKSRMMDEMDSRAAVTEKAFDEFHLYTLRAAGNIAGSGRPNRCSLSVPTESRHRPFMFMTGEDRQSISGWNYENIRENREYGTQSNPKVWWMREFVMRRRTFGHGVAERGKKRAAVLSAGRYGQLEFTGEDTIDHTPRE